MNIIQVNSTFLKAVRWIKYFIAGSVGEALQIAPFGDDSTPPKNTKGVFTSTYSVENPVILGYFNRNQITTEGEKRIFSVKTDGTVATYVYCKKDGILELGGNANFAVKYNELKTELDKLKTSTNNLINAFNTHVHATAAVGLPSPPTTVPNVIPATSNSSDFSSVKNDKIKTI